MLTEDHYSQAHMNFNKWLSVKIKYEEALETLESKKTTIIKHQIKIEHLEKSIEDDKMADEDHLCQLVYK